MKKVILTVGAYGSGKSARVRKLIQELPAGLSHQVCSSSFYFLKDGVYRFRATELSKAYLATRRAFHYALENDVDVIFVDDTNLKFQYRKFYLEYAIDYGYEVEIHVFPAPAGKHVEMDLEPGIYTITDVEDIEVTYKEDPEYPLPVEPAIMVGSQSGAEDPEATSDKEESSNQNKILISLDGVIPHPETQMQHNYECALVHL